MNQKKNKKCGENFFIHFGKGSIVVQAFQCENVLMLERWHKMILEINKVRTASALIGFRMREYDLSKWQPKTLRFMHRKNYSSWQLLQRTNSAEGSHVCHSKSFDLARA